MKFLKKLWSSTAVRHLASTLLSVVISTQLVNHGVDEQDAANIGRAAGTAITGG